MNDEPRDPSWIERYERLSLPQKLAFLAEGSVRLAGAAIGAAVEHSAAVVARARKAYLQGLDPNVEDAKILDEHIAERKRQGDADDETP